MRAHQHEGQVGGVAVVDQAAVVVIHRLEAVLVLQAEHEDHRIHPQRKLHTHTHRKERRPIVRTTQELVLWHSNMTTIYS